MQTLSLIPNSRALLTCTVTIPDPNTPGKETTDSYPCDFKGNRLAVGVPPLPIYRDVYTGKTYVRLAENIPSGTASADRDAAAELLAHNPIHYVNDDGSVKGYFVEAPDFNGREGK